MTTGALIERNRSFNVLVAFAIFSATNGFGQAWVQTTAPNQYWSSLAASADGTKLVAVVGDNNLHPGQIYVSTNAGRGWFASAAPNTNWLAVASSSDGTKLVATVYLPGTMYRSTNSGATWLPDTNAPDTCHSVACSADGS